MSHTKSNKDWDEEYITGEYRNMWDMPYPSQELVTFIASLDFSGDSVALDIGCGAGREAIFLAQQNFQTIGVDLSAEALKIAHQRALKNGVSIDWRQGNVLQLPVETNTVDFVNDRGCFHVIAEEDRETYAQEVDRILKPGGFMLLRGCRESNEEGHHVPVTEYAVDRYLGKYLIHGKVLPIQTITGISYSLNGMKANIVVLRKE